MPALSEIYSKLKESRLFKDSFWALLGSAVGKGLSLLAGIVVARLLGSEVYGEYGTIRNTLLMIAIFSTMGLGYSATKYIAESKENGNYKRVIDTHRIAITITYIVSGFIALLIFISAKQVATWIEAPHLDSVLRLSSIAIIFNAVNTTQTGELAGFGAYKTLASNNTIAGILTFITSIFLTYFYGFNGAIIALIISLAFNALLNRLSINKCLPDEKYNSKIELDYVKEVIKFSIPIALQESLYSITNWLGIFMLIKLSGYIELGLYSAAMQWMSVILFIPGALRNVALSHFAATNKNRKQTHSILKKLMLVNFISTFIPFVGVVILTGWIETMYGESFEGLQPILYICVFCAVVSSLSNVITQEFISQGKNWFLFSSRLIRDLGTLIIAYIAIKNALTGALALALACCILQTVYLIILLSIYFKHQRNE
jgi:O-antigen/teichoic acid export membrane protein